jgi:hypothetical protein
VTHEGARAALAAQGGPTCRQPHGPGWRELVASVEEDLAVQFDTIALAAPATVERVDPTRSEHDWIEAYRRWLGGE